MKMEEVEHAPEVIETEKKEVESGTLTVDNEDITPECAEGSEGSIPVYKPGPMQSSEKIQCDLCGKTYTKQVFQHVEG